MREVIYLKDKVNLDSSVFFGKGVFETILVTDKAIFLHEHLERLNDGIFKLKLGDIIKVEEVEGFIKNNNIKNIVLKIVVTEENIIYTTRKNKYTKEDYKNGFKLKISNVLRNPTSILTYIKSINYIENLIEHEKAQNKGYNEAIFLNIYGNLTEGCTSNIFIIKNDEIITPKVEAGLLPGVMRKWMINNFKCTERNITKEELLAADEVFLTNSLLGIMKVQSIEDIKFNSNKADKIRNIYNETVLGGK